VLQSAISDTQVVKGQEHRTQSLSYSNAGNIARFLCERLFHNVADESDCDMIAGEDASCNTCRCL